MCFGNLTLLLCKICGPFSIVWNTNMAVPSRGCKSRICFKMRAVSLINIRKKTVKMAAIYESGQFARFVETVHLHAAINYR